MTAPLNPQPHGPSDHGPSHASGGASRWQKPPADDTGEPWDPSPGPGPEERRADLRRAGLVAAAVTLCGIVLGLLWLWLAPRVPLISDGEAVYLQHTEGEEAVGSDGTFVLLALALGVVTGAAAFFYHRRGGIALVAGLAVGGVLASVLAWWLGVAFGPTSDVAAHAREVGEGVVFDAPLKLRAKGALLAWPAASMLVHLVLTGAFGPRDPEPAPGLPEDAAPPPHA